MFLRAEESDIQKSKEIRMIEEMHDGEKWERKFTIVKVAAVVFSFIVALLVDSKLKMILHN